MQPFANQGLVDWSRFGPATSLLVHELHYAALAFMTLAYVIKIRQLLKLPAIVEGTPARGDHAMAIRYAYLTLAMPWESESHTRHWWRYIEFSLFHLAAAGAAIGISRLAARVIRAEMRAISSPDDYFCLAMLVVWMATGIFAVPQRS